MTEDYDFCPVNMPYWMLGFSWIAMMYMKNFKSCIMPFNGCTQLGGNLKRKWAVPLSCKQKHPSKHALGDMRKAHICSLCSVRMAHGM